MGDLHCHLRREGFYGRNNDLSATRAAIEQNYVRTAKEEGFSFLGVSFTADNEPWFREMVMEMAREYDGRNGFLLIPNEESQMEYGHIVKINGRPDNPTGKRNGEIWIAAHPQGYWKRDVFLEQAKTGAFDCLELNPWGGYDMKFAVDYAVKAARDGTMAITGSSDAHCQPKMLNRLGRTFVFADELSFDGITTALKQRRCMGSFMEYVIGNVETWNDNKEVIKSKFKMHLDIIA